MHRKSIFVAILALSLASATPAAAWYDWTGYWHPDWGYYSYPYYGGYGYGYDAGAAAMAGGILGLGIGAAIAGAAAQQSQQVTPPICQNSHGRRWYARPVSGAWQC
jgi:hypothetical protein